jgi:hypothetical protein
MCYTLSSVHLVCSDNILLRTPETIRGTRICNVLEGRRILESGDGNRTIWADNVLFRHINALSTDIYPNLYKSYFLTSLRTETMFVK